MNKKHIQERINRCLRLLNSSYRITYWDPRFNVQNSPEHEISKCILLFNLKKEGKKALAEAIFKNGSRADVLVPEDFRVIEVLKTETEEEALTKVKKYPPELDILLLSSKEILKEYLKDTEV